MSKDDRKTTAFLIKENETSHSDRFCEKAKKIQAEREENGKWVMINKTTQVFIPKGKDEKQIVEKHRNKNIYANW